MIPPSDPGPEVCHADEAAFRASFRRGKLLAFVLAVATFLVFSGGSLHDYLAVSKPPSLSDLLGGLVMTGFICWRVFLGGTFARGCLILLAAPALLGLSLGMAALLMNIVPGAHASVGVGNLQGIGRDWEPTVAFLPLGLWGAFALWVLLVSKDARLYTHARRQGITEEAASAFEWPPAHRRQE